jgi:hypothetical protein
VLIRELMFSSEMRFSSCVEGAKVLEKSAERAFRRKDHDF